MTCRYCGTALPDGALFCGECGQPVTAAKTAGVTSAFSIADLAFSSPGDTSEPDDDDLELPDSSPPDAAVPASAAARCPQCGEAMAEGDVFCGECGFVVRAVSPPTGNRPTSERGAPFIVLPDLITLGEFAADPAGSERTDRDQPQPADRDGDATTEVEPLTDDHDVAEVDDLVLGPDPAYASPEPEDDLETELEVDDRLPLLGPARTAKASPRSRPIPDPFPWGIEQPLREDLEATRLVADSASGTRYVLQFSTGESVTVAGSGLVGRNPSMQPGEYVDQLVPIFDAGKSVSKTHLEFGQEAGRFWVTDRYSTNGSVIRQPDAEPRRCDAGRRYFIARGSRVDVGEQFFVVS
jgi:hypothetical protein